MINNVILLTDSPRRIAFAATPLWLGVTIPLDTVGVYMLLHDGRPLYVGRSDNCVLTRLRSHPWLEIASHVVWEPCASPEHAYRHEAAWYHILSPEGFIRNRVHPARPPGYLKNCPFCDAGDMGALEYALPHLREQNVARTASPTGLAVNAKTNL